MKKFIFAASFLLPFVCQAEVSVVTCNQNDNGTSLQITATYEVDATVSSFLNDIKNPAVTVNDNGAIFTARDPLNAANYYLTEFGVGADDRLNVSGFRHNRSFSIVSDAMTLGSTKDAKGTLIWNGLYAFENAATGPTGDQTTAKKRSIVCSKTKKSSSTQETARAF